MKLVKKENIGIQLVYNTNVEEVNNYVGNSVINHNCVIDAGYEGEIHINVINTSNNSVRIYENQKLIQFIELPIFLSEIELEKDLETLHPVPTSRGAKGFGSNDHI